VVRWYHYGDQLALGDQADLRPPLRQMAGALVSAR
jgi:hypothetical protein